MTECIWFWKPQRYWYGWKTLIPITYGYDEYARRTVILGWNITGRVVISLWGLGDPAWDEEMALGRAGGANDRLR